MLFVLKKGIESWLLPLPLVILIFCIGLLFLFFALHKTGMCCIIIALLLLIAFSTRPLPALLLNHLESPFQPLSQVPHDVDIMVVLGGGNQLNSLYPANMRLSNSSLARIVEAVRLLKKTSRPVKLIVSGGLGPSHYSDDKIFRETAIDLGINANEIYLEGGSSDTYQEVQALKLLIGQKPFVLVTSAFHMKRAMLLFKAAGMKAIPAPTQYLTPTEEQNQFSWYAPSGANLTRSAVAIHEYLGMLWYLLTDKISNKHDHSVRSKRRSD